VTSNGIQQKTDFRDIHVHQLRGHARVAKPAGAECRFQRARFRCLRASACSIATTAILACTRQRRVRSGSGADHGGVLDFTIAKGTT